MSLEAYNKTQNYTIIVLPVYYHTVIIPMEKGAREATQAEWETLAFSYEQCS